MVPFDLRDVQVTDRFGFSRGSAPRHIRRCRGYRHRRMWRGAVLYDDAEVAGHALYVQAIPEEYVVTIQPKHLAHKQSAATQHAARSAQEVLAQIEKLRAATQAAADSENFTEWLTRYVRRLAELTEKAPHLTDAATEAGISAQHLDGEHLADVAATACRARDDIYRVYFSHTT